MNDPLLPKKSQNNTCVGNRRIRKFFASRVTNSPLVASSAEVAAIKVIIVKRPNKTNAVRKTLLLKPFDFMVVFLHQLYFTQLP